MTGTPGLMEKNVEQHHAFHPGFFTFRDYCRDTTPEKYDAKKLLGIMDSFAVIFRDHLADEIDTLLALDHCDGAKLKAAYKEMEKKITAASDKVSLVLNSVPSANVRGTDYGLVYHVSDRVWRH